MEGHTMSLKRFSRRDFGLFLAATAVPSSPPLFSSLGAEKEVEWLASVQQCVTPSTDTIQLDSLLIGERGERIESLVDWDRKRNRLVENWQAYLGQLDPNPRPPELHVLEEDRLDGVIRRLVGYEGEPGITVEGYLLIPQSLGEPAPGVVVLHSTTNATIRQPAGLEGDPGKAFGLGLAQRGCVAFCPMCFLWHDKGRRTNEQQAERLRLRHRQATGMAKMLFDASRGLDVLESMKEVDPARLGAVGHSLGAKEVLYLTAFDQRVKAAVSSEGGIGTRFSNWDASWYLGGAIHSFGREHHELLALAAPRPFLLIGGDSADGERSCPFVQAVLPVYELFGKPHRIGLLNHQQGHSVPPIAQRYTYEWLLTYL